MKILPLRTRPPDRRIDRRHAPPEETGRNGYRSYRPCLRWDFGFTCAFCLLHEGDLADLGAEGLGITWIEHFTPVSDDSDRINDYHNCFYTCRFCNHTRRKAPLVDENGRQLIDPCNCVWGERFAYSEDDRLVPNPDDADAVYTAAAYDLNDARKLRRRRLRRGRLTEWLELLGEGPLRLKQLVALAAKATTPESDVLLHTAAFLRACILRAAFEVQRYAAVPLDADVSCSCERKDQRSLPEWIAAQSLEIELIGRSS